MLSMQSKMRRIFALGTILQRTMIGYRTGDGSVSCSYYLGTNIVVQQRIYNGVFVAVYAWFCEEAERFVQHILEPWQKTV